MLLLRAGCVGIFLLFGLGGCQPPSLNAPVDPLSVRPLDLLQSYRDQPEVAKTAYNNIVVSITIQAYAIKGKEIYWYLGSRERPPAIVFSFTEDIPEPKRKGPLVIQGLCLGKKEDGKVREVPGINFTVQLTECQIVSLKVPTER